MRAVSSRSVLCGQPTEDGTPCERPVVRRGEPCGVDHSQFPHLVSPVPQGGAATAGSALAGLDDLLEPPEAPSAPAANPTTSDDSEEAGSRWSKASSTNRRQVLIDQLAAGITQLTSSDKWQEYLRCQARFHRYSFGNTMLIHLQHPGASRVAGFKAWKALGRSVKKGEKALWILAPMSKRVEDDEDPDKTKVITWFKPVPVFDVSQTDGEPLPEPVTKLTGEGPAGVYEKLWQIANGLGFDIAEEEIPGETNGYCDHSNRTIRIEARNEPAQRIKTAVHEIAHGIAHADREHLSREQAELEAESVAYVVCQSLGLETSDYSFGYVAHWAGGALGATEGLRRSCERIQKTSAEILKHFEADTEQAAEAA